MKTVHDIMDKSNKTMEVFFAVCDEMSESKFILAEKKISELLQLIAGSKRLYDIISACTKDYNFSKELMRACREEGDSNWVEFSHMTPSERIAFTFCLLFNFDTHKIDLQTFIHKHYLAENVNLEFALFSQTVINQFKADIQAKSKGEEGGIVYKSSVKAVFDANQVQLQDDFAKEVGKRILSAIEKANLSEYEAALKVGIPPERMSSYIKGDELPPLEALMTICQELATSADYILGLKSE